MIVGFGEILIDFTPMGKGPMGNPAMEMNTGGSPLNCMAAAAKLGGETQFIGMLGQDLFADLITKAMQQANIGIQSLRRTDKAPTTLAFVALDESGERQFSFIRNPGADLLIEFADVDLSVFDRAKAFHFSGLAMCGEPSRTTTMQLAEYAKSKGIPVSYDPNYREPLWNDEQTAIHWMKKGIEYADIVKISDYEVELVFGYGPDDYKRAAQEILDMGASTVLVTCGKDGALYATQEECGFSAGNNVEVADTTGCGDAFLGAYLYGLLYEDMNMAQRVAYANQVAALCATKKGGLPAMPTKKEVAQYFAVK